MAFCALVWSCAEEVEDIRNSQYLIASSLANTAALSRYNPTTTDLESIALELPPAAGFPGDPTVQKMLLNVDRLFILQANLIKRLNYPSLVTAQAKELEFVSERSFLALSKQKVYIAGQEQNEWVLLVLDAETLELEIKLLFRNSPIYGLALVSNKIFVSIGQTIEVYNADTFQLIGLYAVPGISTNLIVDAANDVLVFLNDRLVKLNSKNGTTRSIQLPGARTLSTAWPGSSAALDRETNILYYLVDGPTPGTYELRAYDLRNNLSIITKTNALKVDGIYVDQFEKRLVLTSQEMSEGILNILDMNGEPMAIVNLPGKVSAISVSVD